MENITLLWTLNDIPERPAKRLTSTETSTNRSLTTEQERKIAGHLAFLSATTDNSRKVMAVCVEEKDDHEGLVVRLASNTGDITAVLDGFKEIARILEVACTGGRQ